MKQELGESNEKANIHATLALSSFAHEDRVRYRVAPVFPRIVSNPPPTREWGSVSPLLELVLLHRAAVVLDGSRVASL